MRHVTSRHVPSPPLIGQYMNTGLWLVKTRHVPPVSQSVRCRLSHQHWQPASEPWTNQRPVFRSRDQHWPIRGQQLPQPRESFPLDTTLVCWQRVFTIFKFSHKKAKYINYGNLAFFLKSSFFPIVKTTSKDILQDFIRKDWWMKVQIQKS